MVLRLKKERGDKAPVQDAYLRARVRVRRVAVLAVVALRARRFRVVAVRAVDFRFIFPPFALR